jgi:hypothetical protein
METLGTYLLQMSCWLAAFWLVYMLVLKHETYFELNRWFLNAGLIISVLMPLIPVTYRVRRELKPLVLTMSEGNADAAISSENPMNYWLLVYLAGTLLFLVRMLMQHIRLYRFRKKSHFERVGLIKVYRIEWDCAPFSFFNHIYVSSKMSSDTGLNTVLAHEKVHIRERHWADLLMLEVVRTLQWFNPLILLYRRAMMQNHEYLADAGTIERGVSARTYRAVLANQMLGVPVVSFANSFTLNHYNKRMFMIKKDKSKPVKRLKMLLILPLLAIIVVGFAQPKYVSDAGNQPIDQKETMTVKGKVIDEQGKGLNNASVIIAHSTTGTISDANGDFVLEGLKPDDKLVVSYVGYETQVLPVKSNMLVHMVPAIVEIELRQEEVAPPPPPPPPPASALEFRSIDGKTPLIVIDGKISTMDVNEIDPETIQTMNVLKGEEALAKYGEKAKDGVIEIITKKKASERPAEVFLIVEDMPEFPGGKEALASYVQNEASKAGVSGIAFVKFLIDTDGQVKDAQLTRWSSDEVKEPALNIVNSMPKWKPGSQRGVPVKVNYTVKIEF